MCATIPHELDSSTYIGNTEENESDKSHPGSKPHLQILRIKQVTVNYTFAAVLYHF